MEKGSETRSSEASSFDSMRKNDSIVPLLHEKGDSGKYESTDEIILLKSTTARLRLKHATAPILSSVVTAVFMLLLLLGVEKQRGLRKPQNYVYDAKYTDELQLDTVTCGESITEAMARGCTFDPLADMWLPAECSRAYTHEYLGEYVDMHNNGTPWRYWADEERQHEIFNRSLYVDGTPYFSITKDHIIHCGLNLMRIADAIGTGARVGRMSQFEEHIKHCAKELMRYALRTKDEISTGTQTGMGFC